VLGGSCALAGCALVAGLHDRVLETEAGADSGAAEGGAESGVIDAMTPADGADASGDASCDCCIIYVSMTGDDGNSGCSPSAPKRSVRSAISAVAGAGGQVWICAGTYPEMNLAITSPITVLGSFDCSTTSWTRPVGYGYPSFDAGVATTIEQADGSSNPATLTIEDLVGKADAGDAGITMPLTIDGLTILGPMGGTTSIAVSVTAGAAPHLSNNMIVGGLGTGVVYALLVQDARPEVTNNSISFGATPGQGITVGMGIHGTVGGQGPWVHDNQIRAGNTTSDAGNGSLGLEVVGTMTLTADAGTAIARNLIVAGTVTSSVPSAITFSTGVSLTGDQGGDAGVLAADLIGNDILGGTATTTTGVACTLANVSLQANRIYGGTGQSPGNTSGVSINYSLGFVAFNNMIHGGSGPTAAAAGIACLGCDAAFIADNTIFSGGAGGGTAYALQLQLGGAFNVVGGNILAGIGLGASDYSLYVDNCTEVAMLENNLFLDSAGGLAFATACAPGAGPLMDVTALQKAFVGSSGNLTASVNCLAEDGPLCIAASCMPSCLAMLTAWDLATNGYSSLRSPQGWALVPGDPCAVTADGFYPSAGDPAIPTDITGASRLPAPSIGASQAPADAGCAPDDE
jgi:hypothetical protein